MTRIVYDSRGSNCGKKEVFPFTKNQICDHLPHLRVLRSITKIGFLCVTTSLRETFIEQILPGTFPSLKFLCGPEGLCVYILIS
jgi:hypothetical protein